MPGRAKAAGTKSPGRDQRPETTAIVLRIAADHAKDFEAMFEAEEIPIWDDFTRRGRFLQARLVRASGGSEQRGGIQDYLLHIVAADSHTVAVRRSPRIPVSSSGPGSESTPASIPSSTDSNSTRTRSHRWPVRGRSS